MNKKGTLLFGRVSSWYLGCKLKASATLSTSLRWCLLARTSQCLVFHLDVRCRSQCAEGGPNSVSKNHVSSSSKTNLKAGPLVILCLFFWPEPVAFRRVYGTWDLLVYHVTIAAPYPGGIDPRLAVYARSWDGHYTTTRRDRLPCNSLSWPWKCFLFFFMLMQEVPCFQCLQSRRGHALHAKRIGTRTKRSSWGLETVQ